METPFGVPIKSGTQEIGAVEWDQMRQFVESRLWLREPLEDDREDPLLADLGRGPEGGVRGAFMMGFDFHLGPNGPRLIEVNTNAGGLATVFSFPGHHLKQLMRLTFVGAVRDEWRRFQRTDPLKTLAIVDDDARQQKLYPETLEFSKVLVAAGIDARVCSPEELVLDPATQQLRFASDQVVIDFVYNRLCDFHLKEQSHLHLRQAALAKTVVLSPHPSLYARTADKRHLVDLSRMADDNPILKAVIPKTFMIGDRPMEYWQDNKKQYVFKPIQGYGSRGVYMGRNISRNKIATLPASTIVQEVVDPPVSEDGSKFDLRIFTHDTRLLGIATRHYCLQLMEMKSDRSGFRNALPKGVCCFPQVDNRDLMDELSRLKQHPENTSMVARQIAQLCKCEHDEISDAACCKQIEAYLKTVVAQDGEE